MLDPTWAATRPLLWIVLVAMLVLLALRTIRKDRREYQRFKRYRGTVKRQAVFRRWLRESFLTFGGLSLVLLLLAGSYVGPLLAELQGWAWVSGIRSHLWIPGVVAVVVIVLTWLGIRAARHDADGIMAVGDIQALLLRNRQELRLGALLSINAGIVEELAFRLAIPALVFGASGSAVAAVAASVMLFGALHLYQGAAGIIGTTIIGVAMMALYVVSGSIVAPIVLHALIDLRSLVLIPVAVMGVHRVDGRLHPWLPAMPRNPPATVAPPEAAPAAATSTDGPGLPPQPYGDHDDQGETHDGDRDIDEGQHTDAPPIEQHTTQQRTTTDCHVERGREVGGSGIPHPQ